MSRSLQIVCMSDTHNKHELLAIPDGDILIHAGDMSSRGKLGSIEAFNDFLGTLPHPHKVLIAGNHDFAFERTPEAARRLITNAIYLQDEEVLIEGIRIYGSPWQPWFFNWAFNLQRGEEIRAKWDLIPDQVDILVTHGPAYGHGDRVERGELVGCRDLLEVIEERVRPKYHIFGHIHEAYGMTSNGTTTFLNVSSCNLAYQPIQPPVTFSWEIPREASSSID